MSRCSRSKIHRQKKAPKDTILRIVRLLCSSMLDVSATKSFVKSTCALRDTTRSYMNAVSEIFSSSYFVSIG